MGGWDVDAGAEVQVWKGLSLLRELNLKGCYKIEDAGLQGLSLLTSLTSINMQECWQITAQGLAALSGAPSVPPNWRSNLAVLDSGRSFFIKACLAVS